MWHKLLLPFMEERWSDIPKEQCWWGPAGTSKTMSTFIVLDTILRDPRFEGVRILWMRRTLASCKQSSLVTFEEQVLLPSDPILGKRQRSQREHYVYERPNRLPNELVIGGMNIATRLFGSEFDIVVAEEAIEFDESNLETIWRGLRPRSPGLGLPFKALILLTNPDSQFHWLYSRMETGRTAGFFVGVECNPAYFDLRTQTLTEAGRGYYDNMRSQMQDERYARLVEGRWVAAEGQILKTFCPAHLVNGDIVREPYRFPRLVLDQPHKHFGQEIELQWFFASLDFGDRSPGALEVWGVTRVGMLVRVAEVYHTDRDIQWWAEWCSALYGEFGLRAIACDNSRPKEIDYINDLIAEDYRLQRVEEKDKYGEKRMVSPRIALGAQKNTQAQDSKTNVALLRYAFGLDNGCPRILIVQDCERVIDPNLRRENKPLGLVQEIPGWTWAKHDPNKHAGAPREVADPHRPNHGLDSTAYGVAYAWGRDLSRDPSKDKPKVEIGSYAHHRRFVPWKNTKLAKRLGAEAERN